MTNTPPLPKDDRSEQPGKRRVLAPGRYRLGFTCFGFAMVAFGLLLWARLMLVTSHPRTAFAEPETGGAPTIAIDRASSDDKPTPNEEAVASHPE